MTEDATGATRANPQEPDPAATPPGTAGGRAPETPGAEDPAGEALDLEQARAALAAARQALEEARAEAEAARSEAAAARAEADAARRRADEALDQLRRLQADFTNYRRRMLEEQGRWRQEAEAELARSLLPVVDNLERALAAAGDDGHPLAQGVAMVHRQFLEVLRQAGVEPIEAQGQPFDPYRHEAVARVETDAHPDGTVIEVFQRGYLYRGRTLRPAMVKVAVAPPAAAGAGGDGAGAAAAPPSPEGVPAGAGDGTPPEEGSAGGTGPGSTAGRAGGEEGRGKTPGTPMMEAGS